MSQHHVQSTFGNRPVLVVGGWDRPLQCVFMTIQFIDRDDKEEFVYSNLDDPNAFNVQDVDYFIAILNALAIPAPMEMWRQIQYESQSGGANRLVRYELDGTVISDTTFGRGRPLT